MIPLHTLRQFQLQEMSALLSWLESLSSIRGAADYTKRRPPIQTGKVIPALTALEEFGFIEEGEDRLSLTAAGRGFYRSSPMLKRATMRALFLRDEPVKRIVELLDTSTTGRLPRTMVNESFAIGALGPVKDADVQGFIAWAEACELFGYDKMADEIFRLERRRIPSSLEDRWVPPQLRGFVFKAS